MSRLESMRRRLTAQIDGLAWAAETTAALMGDALDIGLGNGRTFDHMRQILPNRRIWVIDREMNAHPSCVPPEADFLQGEADAMLAKLKTAQAPIVFAHYDLGIGVEDFDAKLRAELAPIVAELIIPGGVIVSGQPLPDLPRVDGPGLEDPDRYFFYQL